jgi:hypothetical protein
MTYRRCCSEGRGAVGRPTRSKRRDGGGARADETPTITGVAAITFHIVTPHRGNQRNVTPGS